MSPALSMAASQLASVDVRAQESKEHFDGRPFVQRALDVGLVIEPEAGAAVDALLDKYKAELTRINSAWLAEEIDIEKALELAVRARFDWLPMARNLVGQTALSRLLGEPVVDYDLPQECQPWPFWIWEVLSLGREENRNATLRLSLDLNLLLASGGSEAVDAVLGLIDVSALSKDVLVTMISGTVKAASELCEREAFRERVRFELKSRGQDPDPLFAMLRI